MTTDARITTALPSHPKTKKVIRRLGHGGAWHLICLFLWVASNRPDGDLSGMTAEDIELAVDWPGEADAFVDALVAVGFLDGAEEKFRIHDWAEHNPWVNGADMRSAKARWNAVKRHHGEREADRQVPEWALARTADSNASSTKNDASSNASSNASSRVVAMLEPERSNAPSPSPSPSIKQEQETPDGVPANPPAETLELTNVSHHPDSRVVQAVLKAYNETLPNCRRAVAVTPKLQRRILTAHKLAKQLCHQLGWTYVAADFWESYFGECLQDPWLRGDVPNPNNPRWKQNLAVLLDEDRYAEIMDKAIASMADAA